MGSRRKIFAQILIPTSGLHILYLQTHLHAHMRALTENKHTTPDLDISTLINLDVFLVSKNQLSVRKLGVERNNGTFFHIRYSLVYYMF